jgi:hypothetical protein
MRAVSRQANRVRASNCTSGSLTLELRKREACFTVQDAVNSTVQAVKEFEFGA